MKFILSLMLLAWTSTSLAQKTTNLRKSLVSVIVYKQEPDIHDPWKEKIVRTEEHVGTVVTIEDSQEKGILVQASAITFAKRIEMKRISSTEPVELKTHFADFELNLAVLKPVEEDALDELKELPCSDQELAIEDEAYVHKIENGVLITRQAAPLRIIGFGEREDVSSYPVVNYVFKFPRKDLGWSEPIISKGKLVAMAVAQDSQDYVHAIPSSIIDHFLNDDLSKNYQGFPTLGIQISAHSSPYMREALGAGSIGSQGALIGQVKSYSPFFNRIKEGDVLLSIDGVPINARGNFTHSVWGEFSAGAILYKYYAGEKIKIEVFKDKKRQKFEGILQRYNSNTQLIPYYDYNNSVDFLIVGGLVFQELSRSYLRAWGNNWYGDAPSSLVYLWTYKNLSTNNHNRIIVLNQVLGDPFNKGYQGMANAPVKLVNGMQVHSLDELREALNKLTVKDKENYLRVLLDYGEGEIILGYKDLAEANARIAKNYAISQEDAFFLPKAAGQTEH